MVEWVGNYTHVSVEYNESGMGHGLDIGRSYGIYLHHRIISGLCRITAQR
jgi:hypothetical protein